MPGLWRSDAPFPRHLLQFLRTESARLGGPIAVPRPWHYAELHNPWSRAAAVFDSWGFLDLCQSSSLIEQIATLIGPDIILFDSQWLPDRWQRLEAGSDLESDAHRFPVDPPSGLTVLIGVIDAPRNMVRVRSAEHADAVLDLEPGTVLFLDSRLPYCVCTAGDGNAMPSAYAARYFPASSRYDRDAASPMHRALTERYPLLNYARLPIWLVHGQDQAGNDFVTGFNVRAGYWTNANW